MMLMNSRIAEKLEKKSFFPRCIAGFLRYSTVENYLLFHFEQTNLSRLVCSLDTCPLSGKMRCQCRIDAGEGGHEVREVSQCRHGAYHRHPE